MLSAKISSLWGHCDKFRCYLFVCALQNPHLYTHNQIMLNIHCVQICLACLQRLWLAVVDSECKTRRAVGHKSICAFVTHNDKCPQSGNNLQGRAPQRLCATRDFAQILRCFNLHTIRYTYRTFTLGRTFEISTLIATCTADHGRYQIS